MKILNQRVVDILIFFPAQSLIGLMVVIFSDTYVKTYKNCILYICVSYDCHLHLNKTVKMGNKCKLGFFQFGALVCWDWLVQFVVYNVIIITLLIID